jgi:hypothetical protein
VNEGKVKFQVVVTEELDEDSLAAVKSFIKKLQNLGLEIDKEPVKDTEADKVRDCEIIFGTGAKNREGCSVDIHTVGADGYSISIVGDRVLVAAGSAERYGEP